LLIFRSLVKRREVLRYRVQVASIEAHRRHKSARLEVRRIIDKGAQVLRGVRYGAGRNGRATGDMRKVRTEGPPCRGAGDGVAVDTGVGFKNGAAVGCRRILRRGLPLLSDPGGKVRWGIGVDPDQHLCVLRAAVLPALSQIESWLVGI